MARSGKNTGRPGAPVGLLAAGACTAIAVAALGLRVAAHSATRGAGPLDAEAVLIAIPFGVICAIAAARYRTLVRYAEPASAATDRMRSATVALLSVCAVLVPLTVLLFWHGPDGGPQDPGAISTHPHPTLGVPTQQPSAVATKPARPFEFGIDLKLLFVVVGIVVLVVIGGLLIWLILRLVRGPQADPVQGTAPAVSAAPEEQDALADALSSARGALTGTDARAAIIACYLAMQDALAESGIVAAHSDTPADLLHRAARGGFIGRGALAGPSELAALFREARFSSHPMNAAHLERARAALDATVAHLAERRALVAAAGTAAPTGTAAQR